MAYLTFQALHIVAMVAWFAAMFYLPRLFVYHTETTEDSTLTLLGTMEQRLYRMIMTPAAVLTLLFGSCMVVMNWAYLHTAIWFWLKMVLVLALFAYHGMCGGMVRKFRNGANTRSPRFYRIFNELPLIALLAIVLLATFKPTLN